MTLKPTKTNTYLAPDNRYYDPNKLETYFVDDSRSYFHFPTSDQEMEDWYRLVQEIYSED